MSRARLGAAIALTTWLLAALPAMACIPIVQVSYVFWGPAFWAGSRLATYSMLGMAIVVAVKCVAFQRADAVLPAWLRAPAMIVANVVSTFIGLIVAAIAASGGVGFIFQFIFQAICFFPFALRLQATWPWPATDKWKGPAGFLPFLVLPVLDFIGFYLFMQAQDPGDRGDLATYWALRVVCVLVGMATTMLVTVAVEETAISAIGLRWRRASFLPAVARANLAAYFVAAAFGAAVALPQRLYNQDYYHRPTPPRLAALQEGHPR